ncbi:MAG: C39 family peptidase, partial [Anaerolineaceae bacterium]|nr:C39 family peptidase [Anaerolineaceae bacterium]
LRNHGLNAIAVHYFPFEDLQRQIASGNPAIVWVIGHVWAGTPVQYTDSQGRTTTVARYEHTVMVIGYNATSVTILDGDTVYQRSLSSFFDSWGVLNNMAVILN